MQPCHHYRKDPSLLNPILHLIGVLCIQAELPLHFPHSASCEFAI